MQPPIFAPHSGGNEAQQHLHRARQFRAAAAGLPNYVNGEQNWPRYALITHAIELALKGFAIQCVSGGKVPGHPRRHDLMGWYQAAIVLGLNREPGITENIAALNYLHETNYMRYPKGDRPAPNPEIIADQTVDHLLFEITQVVNPR